MKQIALYVGILLVLCSSLEAQVVDSTKYTKEDSVAVTQFINTYLAKDTTAQDTVVREYLTLQHKQYEDSVVLRWAPTTRRLWLKANQLGYVLRRYESILDPEEDTLDLSAGPDIPATLTELATLANPVKPYDSVRWSTVFPTNDKYAIVAAGATAGALEVDEGMGFGVKAEQDQSIYGLILLSADLSVTAANGLGFRYVDKNVKKGATYEYRVTLADEKEIQRTDSLLNLKFDDLDSMQVMQWIEWLDEQDGGMFTYTGQTNPMVLNGLFSESLDKAVQLLWPVETNTDFTAYFIERSVDGGATYDSLTENAFIGMPVDLYDSATDETIQVYRYLDELDENYVAYTYRITGLDGFGDRSIPVTVKGIGLDRTPPANPKIREGKYIEKTAQIKLTYDPLEIPDDFGDFFLEYANHKDSSYARYAEESLNPNDSVYLHKVAPEEYAHYFRLAVTDTAGNCSYSFPVFVNVPDTIPPPKPTGLFAEIDTTGKVHIKWDEEFLKVGDLLGFRVFFSNDQTREFSQLTRKPELSNFYSYTIPLNTLTEKIYFKVQAVDRSYNHSAFSEIIEAQKPDTIPPVGPVFRSPNIEEDRVVLSWAPSSSRDVIGYLLTKQPKDGETEAIMLNDPSTISYTDTELEPGVRYYYTIVAIDDASLHSKNPYELQVKLVDKKRLEGISNLKVRYNKNQEEVTITWDSNEVSEDVKYVIYRNVDEEKLKRYHLVDDKKYVDKVSQEGIYYYGVRVVKKDGSKSRLSEAESVRVNK